MTNKTFDFDTNFVSVESQEKGSEFEVISDAGKKTGMFIRLAGPDSPRRKRTQARLKDFYLKSGIGVPKADAVNNRKARRALATQGDRYSGETADQFYELRMDDLVAAIGNEGRAHSYPAAQQPFARQPGFGRGEAPRRRCLEAASRNESRSA